MTSNSRFHSSKYLLLFLSFLFLIFLPVKLAPIPVLLSPVFFSPSTSMLCASAIASQYVVILHLFFFVCVCVCVCVCVFVPLCLLVLFISLLCLHRLTVPVGCSVELTGMGAQYLNDMFHRFDKVRSRTIPTHLHASKNALPITRMHRSNTFAIVFFFGGGGGLPSEKFAILVL